MQLNLYGGKLESISRYDLVAGLRLARLSGSLLFTRGKAEKELRFSDGFIVGSRSNQNDDAVGVLLLRWGVISAEAHRKLQLKAGGASKMQFGEHLLAMGAIDRLTLKEALREQTLRRTGDLFAWPDGSYMFTPGEVSESLGMLTCSEVFGAAVRYAYGTDFLRFASTMLLDVVPSHRVGSPYEILVADEPELGRLFDRVTGKIPFRGLAGPSASLNFWQTAFALRELGCIDFELPPDLAAIQGQDGGDDRSVGPQKPTQEEELRETDRSVYLRASRNAFRRGRSLLLESKFAEAERAFYTAVSLAPDAGEYVAHLAWSRLHKHAGDKTVLTRARAMLRKATQAAPASADAAYFHGGALWLSGMREAALAEFNRALQLDKGHAGALKVLEALAKQRVADPI